MRRAGAKPDEVDDFNDAERVEDKEGDEPFFLAVASGMPESESFEDRSPDGHDDEEGENCAHESKCKRRLYRRGVKWRKVVHMRGLYHTLHPCGISE